ncbi:nucleotidyltransferase domain-containing protein [Herminiimonas sp. CN]|uniref:nucleotidyltransferase domain-containing protein n=1 Tax=Herminiimonas sp. CN TaxID=1349818 RepID=UPI000473357C|nr:nucleotidyltransferase domain-containing protein [Herminiimonas sp. CN]
MRTETASRFGLTESTIGKIAMVFSQHPEIEKALLYGSRAKGNYRRGSDIDLTLIGDALSHALLSRIETQIDDLLLPYTVDLSLFKHIDNPDLVDHIDRVGIVFYEKIGLA